MQITETCGTCGSNKCNFIHIPTTRSRLHWNSADKVISIVSRSSGGKVFRFYSVAHVRTALNELGIIRCTSPAVTNVSISRAVRRWQLIISLDFPFRLGNVPVNRLGPLLVGRGFVNDQLPRHRLKSEQHRIG